jgi:hypothetical protein
MRAQPVSTIYASTTRREVSTIYASTTSQNLICEHNQTRSQHETQERELSIYVVWQLLILFVLRSKACQQQVSKACQQQVEYVGERVGQRELTIYIVA